MHAVWVLGALLFSTLFLYVLGVNGAISSVLEREQLEKQISILKADMTRKELSLSVQEGKITAGEAAVLGFVKASPEFVAVRSETLGFNAR